MIYSYIVTRDYGFAPNPFYGICTLATCKPKIREKAKIGDWVVGFGSGSKGSKYKNKIIFAMKVEAKISFDEYWDAPQFQCKKPVMNGSLKQNYGDNIYHKQDGEWIQSDSHHSETGGKPNLLNLNRDTSSNNVLISTDFWYFGKDAIDCPSELKSIIPNGRGQRVSEDIDIISSLSNYFDTLADSDVKGFIGEPEKFKEGFQRYDGK